MPMEQRRRLGVSPRSLVAVRKVAGGDDGERSGEASGASPLGLTRLPGTGLVEEDFQLVLRPTAAEALRGTPSSLVGVLLSLAIMLASGAFWSLPPCMAASRIPRPISREPVSALWLLRLLVRTVISVPDRRRASWA